ncbi:hypothetical protein E3P99_02381 [Wallemia hederae]|uniref:Uncharacterized protein n=1 Tax=Wallemia hederae TaxID=1540922 RepID=A0A4T0FJX2_9BASI|nr:hypothetical protein E3P99_02381 [Wallemia hederae]
MNQNELSEITEEFYAPTEGFRLGELIYSPGFTLLDAMSAIHVGDRAVRNLTSHPSIKIGDSRMDSFLSSSTQVAETFNPHQQLSVDDICYIIDRTTALELCFYSGSHLLQSSYTSLYLHKLSSTSIELLKMQSVSIDSKEPYEWEWIGLVLRSALIASLKCVNFAWFELVKGVMYDIEDFNADRAGLSLGEMYDDVDVDALLEDALSWLEKVESADGSIEGITALKQRIQLRRELFKIYDPHATNSTVEMLTGQYDASLASINHALSMIGQISPCPVPSEVAQRAFFADISKYLSNMAPLPPLDASLLKIEGTNVWEGFRVSLESIKDINQAIRVQDPLEWVHWVSQRSISRPSDRALPAFVRNLTVSRFISDDNLVFHQHSVEWITDVLLEGMIGLPRGMIELVGRLNEDKVTTVGRNPMSVGQAFIVWSQRVAGFFVNLIATYCHNRPRQKRNLPKSIKQFEELHYETSAFIDPIIESLQQLSPVLASLVSQIPFAMRSFILSLHIESLLVTTELDLLDKEHDWSILYWQLSRVARIWQRELYSARSLLSSLPIDTRVGLTTTIKSNALEWMKERTSFANLVETMSLASLRTLQLAKLGEPAVASSERQARFQRRLKWAMRGDIGSEAETDPSFEEYESDMAELHKVSMLSGVLKQSNHIPQVASPEPAIQSFTSALERIDDLLAIDVANAHLKLAEERRLSVSVIARCDDQSNEDQQTLGALRRVCQTNIDCLTQTPATLHHTLEWSNSIHPWYPNLSKHS